jgi:hypothetical protein
MDDLHEAEFSWPYGDASDVILTGSFDHWSCTMHLPKGASGFVGNVRVPWNEKVPYKFIVDGKWVTRSDRPTELDGAGNLNNVLIAPSKPTPITEHPSTTASKGPTDSMTSATTFPEESLLSSETSPQKALEPDQQGGITESDSTDTTSAVDDVDGSDEKVVSIHVPDIIVESTEPPALSGEVDTFHAIVDTATSAASHVSEEVASALEYVSSGISYMFSSTPRVSTDNVNALGTTEQPSTTSAIEPIVAEAPTESAQGAPSSDVTVTTPHIAPVVPILILPVNDYMLNEAASPLPDQEIGASDPLASGSLDATISVLEPSTHFPILLSKPAPSVTQEAQVAEQDSKPTEQENLEAQAAEEKNEELLVDAVAPPSDAAAPSTTPEIDVNPDRAQITDASAVDAEPIAPNNELSLPAPEPQGTSAVTASPMPSTNDDLKDSKEVSFPASTTTDSTVIPSSKFSTASTKKKRRSLFAKLREFFSHREKTKK